MSEHYVYAYRISGDTKRVKIGSAKDWRRRIRTHSTSVPGKPDIVCLIEVDGAEDAREVERSFKKVFRDKKVQGEHEWFELDDEKVITFLERCGTRRPVPELDGNNATKISGGENDVRKRQPPFRFSMLKIPNGTELQHRYDPQTKCTVRSDNKVEFDGELMTLSKAGQIVCERLGISWTSYGGPHLWMFEGEILSHIRRRKDESG